MMVRLMLLGVVLMLSGQAHAGKYFSGREFHQTINTVSPLKVNVEYCLLHRDLECAEAEAKVKSSSSEIRMGQGVWINFETGGRSSRPPWTKPVLAICEGKRCVTQEMPMEIGFAMRRGLERRLVFGVWDRQYPA